MEEYNSKVFYFLCILCLFSLFVRVPPQIKRPNREVKPLRRESPGLQRGPVGRAQPISKNEKPANSRERESKGKGKDEKVGLEDRWKWGYLFL